MALVIDARLAAVDPIGDLGFDGLGEQLLGALPRPARING